MQLYLFCIIIKQNYAKINGENGMNAGIQPHTDDSDHLWNGFFSNQTFQG